MNIKIEFHTDNAAFEDNFLMEITSVLRSIKESILDSENATDAGIEERPLKDSNGNTIGFVTVMGR